MIRRPTVRALRAGLLLLETEVDDFDVRAAVVVGGAGAVVWDTLAHPAQMEEVGALVARTGQEAGGSGRPYPHGPHGASQPPAARPLTVVYSHADWDHVWGTAGLSGIASVVAHAHAARRFHSDVPEDLRSRREREPGAWDAVRLVPPSVTLEAVLILDLGGVTMEVHPLPGHTPDCVVGWIPAWGALLAGDAVETPLPLVNDGAAVPAWIDGLGRWAADPAVAIVVPSHGRVGGRELVADNLRYLDGLALGRGPSDPEALPPFYRQAHARNLERVAGG